MLLIGQYCATNLIVFRICPLDNVDWVDCEDVVGCCDHWREQNLNYRTSLTIYLIIDY